MTCKNCSHYIISQRGKDGYVDYSATTGECTRFPEWKSVEQYHFCGELRVRLDRIYDNGTSYDAPVTHRLERRKDKWIEENTYFKQQNTLLNKQNKELRKLYREKTGKIAQIKTKSKEAT